MRWKGKKSSALISIFEKIIGYIWSNLMMAYAIIGFDLLVYQKYSVVYSAVYYFGHVFIVSYLLIDSTLLSSPQSKKKAE
jgi:hypothetical protein